MRQKTFIGMVAKAWHGLGGLLGRGKDGGEGGPPGEAKPAQTLRGETEEASEAGCRLRAGVPRPLPSLNINMNIMYYIIISTNIAI